MYLHIGRKVLFINKEDIGRWTCDWTMSMTVIGFNSEKSDQPTKH